MTKDKVDDPCAPKEGEEKKDMRGTYAKLNIIRNKFRAAGQRTPFVTLDDIDEEKTENSPLHKPGGPNSQYEKDGTPKKKKGPPENKGPERPPEKPTNRPPRRTGEPLPKKSKERYNPFTKDGKTRPGDKTPTSASETTGP